MTAGVEARLCFSDHELARRLERAEAASNARFVEARKTLFPDCDSEWIEVAGTYAIYDGSRSPLTQTFGVGLFAEITAAELDRLESFYENRSAITFHEISPLAHKSLWPLLADRGYVPVEFTSLLFLSLGDRRGASPARASRVRVRTIADHERDLWALTTVRGWMDHIDFADLMLDLARVTAARASAPAFLAEIDGQAIAAGAMSIHEGVALLAGACTVPEARRQGAQLALLDARLGYAAEAGCDLAMIGAEPGSASQRNAERHGFRIAYTRVKWQKR